MSVIFVLGCVALLCVGKGPDQTRFFFELECVRVRVCVFAAAAAPCGAVRSVRCASASAGTGVARSAFFCLGFAFP